MQNYGQGKGNPVKMRLKIGLITYTCFLKQRGRGSTSLEGTKEVSMVLALLFNVLCQYKGLLFFIIIILILFQLKFSFWDSDKSFENKLRNKSCNDIKAFLLLRN